MLGQTKPGAFQDVDSSPRLTASVNDCRNVHDDPCPRNPVFDRNGSRYPTSDRHTRGEVVWNYPGLSPEDMERRIVLISEGSYSTTVNGIERIESQCLPNTGGIRISFQPALNWRRLALKFRPPQIRCLGLPHRKGKRLLFFCFVQCL